MCVYILLVSPSQGIFSSLQSELTVSCEGFSLLACYKKAVEKMRKLRAPSASCRLGRRPSGGLTVSCGWLPSPALALAPFAGRSRLLVPLVRACWFQGRSPARRWASAGSSRARQESKAPTRARRQLTSCAPRAAAGAQRPSTDGFLRTLLNTVLGAAACFICKKLLREGHSPFMFYFCLHTRRKLP